MRKPLLLTGATGFLGRHVLGALAGSRPVVAPVRKPEEWSRLDWTDRHPEVSVVSGGLMDVSCWQPALPAIGAILHLAAPVQHSRRAPPAMRTAIVEGTLSMVRLAAALRCRLVVASTSGTVGCTRERGPRADERAPFVTQTVAAWPYYRAKIEMEQKARTLANDLGVELVFLRPPILLGPGDHRLRSTSTIHKFIRRKFPLLVRGGMHFADVRDAAHAFVRALEHPEPKPIYHLDGTECGVEEFFDMLEAISGVPRTRFVLPFGPARVAAQLLERLHVVPDPVVIEMASHWWGLTSLHSGEDLEWKTRDPRETLRDTVEWLRAHAPA